MALKNTVISYGSMAKFLHWLIFVMVAGMLIAGFTMGNAPDSVKGMIYNTHKITGITILLIMLFRLTWTLSNPKPKLPDRTAHWELWLRNLVHWLLYLLLIAMPITGWVMSSAAGRDPHFFNLITFHLPVPLSKPLAHQFHELHEIIAWIIVCTLTLHILAGLKHHFINRDHVLRRMLPRFK